MRHQPGTPGKADPRGRADAPEPQDCIITDQTFLDHQDLERFGFEFKEPTATYKAPQSLALEEALRAAKVDFDCETENPPETVDTLKREVLEGVKRWFYNDWRRIENKLRTSIVEGISVFLSLFEM